MPNNYSNAKLQLRLLGTKISHEWETSDISLQDAVSAFIGLLTSAGFEYSYILTELEKQASENLSRIDLNQSYNLQD